VLTEDEKPFIPAAEHFNDHFDRLQQASHCVVQLALEELFDRTLMAEILELTEAHVDAPGSTCAQVYLIPRAK